MDILIITTATKASTTSGNLSIQRGSAPITNRCLAVKKSKLRCGDCRVRVLDGHLEFSLVHKELSPILKNLRFGNDQNACSSICWEERGKYIRGAEICPTSSRSDPNLMIFKNVDNSVG
ncbi:hypothetical protein ACH5RR_014341 [Cinchona calisaya]|uniref:Uncharacterized protein n=1 Tax=Cinchona calisaya TaxID=153742 RepID=A0ABD3A2N9_9GENT